MISSTVRKAGPFVGDGVVVAFPFAFKVFQASDLEVVQQDTDGALTTLELTTDYTVALNSDQDAYPGGSVTLSAPLTLNYRLIITSAVPETQQVELSNLGGFYPDVLNDEFDKLTILIQQLQEQVRRTIQFAITDSASVNNELPAAAVRAGKYLMFAGDGSVSLGDGGGGGNVQLFSGTLTGTKNGSNQVFTLTNNGVALTSAPSQAVVWCNFPLIPGSGYTYGPGAGQVTFAIAPKSSDYLYAQGIK